VVGNRWLRPLLRDVDPRPDRPLLVCLPHAGGSARYFRPLAEELAADLDVLAVQYPGRQERLRDPHPGTVVGLADGVLDALAGVPHRRYALFGHSMGAVVGCEVARRAAAHGLPRPDRLFASGRPAPAAARPPGPDRPLTDEELVADLVRLGGTEEAELRDPLLLRLVLPAARTDYLAVDRHREEPGLRLDCPVTALVGDADPDATVPEAAAWERHSAPGFRLEVFPGGHFYLDSGWPRLAAVVRAGQPDS
jgi:pyochelin biosynthesis protein PchC